MTEGFRDRWRTPEPVLDFAREIMGGDIQLDPSTDESNPTGSRHIRTIADNALKAPWPHVRRTFLNPPFTQLKPFAERLADYLGREQCAVFIGSYALEAGWARKLAQVRTFGARPKILHPSPRLRFVLAPDAPPDTPQPGGYPTTVWAFCDLAPGQILDSWRRHTGTDALIVEVVG